MRLVHLSDLHLGYRQYQRLTPTGINQREADVARTFSRAVERIIELRPDLVLVAGDIFHTSRPSNAAILHAFKQFARLHAELPETAIVMAAGDHDTPRTTESGSIMGLFEAIPNVHVASHEAKRFSLPEHDVSILAVPDGAGAVALTPDRDARHNILLIHADVDDVVPRYYADLDRATVRISTSDLGVTRWSYVALGHYHVYHRVAENAFYSGSLDYTSLNVWFDNSEERDRRLPGKGFILFDLHSGEQGFEAVPASREFVPLDIDARGLTPAEVDAAIRRAVDRVKGGIDDKVVRVVLREIPRQVSRELDHRALRDYKKRALSFHLDARKPETTRRDASGAPARRPSVVDVVREHLTHRDIAQDLDRGRLVELGMKYLSEADAFPPAAVVGVAGETES